jgi:hypothetical protein
MKRIFLRPLYVILVLGFLSSLGIASDIAQLTNFNTLDYIMKHAPLSYFVIIIVIFVIYIILVLIGLFRKVTGVPENHLKEVTGSNSSQNIKTKNVSNSIIIQSRGDKEK